MATRWEGRERLRRRFERLPVLAKQRVRDAVEQGAKEIVAAQKRAAPDRDAGPGLKEAIQWAFQRSSSALVQIVIRVGVPYAHLVEFGTAPHKAGGRFKGAQHPGTKPQPFFFPTYRALKKRVRSRISRAFGKAVRDSRNI